MPLGRLMVQYLEQEDSAFRLFKRRWISVLMHLFGAVLIFVTGFKTPALLRYTIGSGYRTRSAFVVALLFAVVLLFWKRYFLFLYGLIEVVFALWGCWYVLESSKDILTTLQLISLFGSLYLIVRGLDNFLTGCRELSEKLSFLQKRTKR